MKNFTAICHNKKSNYQVDFPVHPDIENKFTKYCKTNGVVWARLFNEDDGTPIAKYDEKAGFVWLQP